jgi:hypothetical protein
MEFLWAQNMLLCQFVDFFTKFSYCNFYTKENERILFFEKPGLYSHIYFIEITFQDLQRHPKRKKKLQRSPCIVILPVVLVAGGWSTMELEAYLLPDD